MGADSLVVICVWLTTWRLTRLVVTDKITEKLRDRAQVWFEFRWLARKPKTRKADPVKWLSPGAYLLTCPWCMSIWLGAPITAAGWAVHRFPVPIFVWIAASGVTGFLATVEAALEGDS